jgi:hypothetical protein
MLAVRMMNRMRETLGVELTTRWVFQARTIEALALRIDAAPVQRPDSSWAGRGKAPREGVDF